jgi:hypothetical protein
VPEEPALSRPRERTVRGLFARSRNRCAFPRCQVQAFDTEKNSLLVEICHIEGNRPNSPRYRAEQSPEDRQGLENLVLLCGVHHKVIDDDDISYTVERLKAMKATHESIAEDTPVPPEAVSQLIARLASGSMQAGTIIISQNQMGGQTAHTIVNAAQPGRSLSAAVSEGIVKELRTHPPREFSIQRVDGDVEVISLADQLLDILPRGGWQLRENSVAFGWSVRGMGLTMNPDPERRVPDDVAYLAKVLIEAGIMSQSFIEADPHSPVLKVVVGYRP